MKAVRWTILIAVFVLVGVSPAMASAQIRDGLGSSLVFTGGALALANRSLEPGWGEHSPAPLQDARLTLRSPRFFTGGMLRETLILHAVRWSFGVGAAALPGEGARVDGLAPGYEARGRPPWAALFDFALGKHLRVGSFMPYFEARTALSIVTSRVELRIPSEGRLSATTYQTTLFELGPRAGFWLPIGPAMHLDFSMRAGLLGPERFGADLGVGFYLPWGSPYRGSR